jgi:hypothetical protein
MHQTTPIQARRQICISQKMLFIIIIIINIIKLYIWYVSVPGAARSKALICGRSLLRFQDRILLTVCCHVEVSASCWSLVQRGPTDCGVSIWVWW